MTCPGAGGGLCVVVARESTLVMIYGSIDIETISLELHELKTYIPKVIARL